VARKETTRRSPDSSAARIGPRTYSVRAQSGSIPPSVARKHVEIVALRALEERAEDGRLRAGMSQASAAIHSVPPRRRRLEAGERSAVLERSRRPPPYSA
jgi:hypothetical protein